MRATCLLLGTLLATAVLAAPQRGQELLTNPGFERPESATEPAWRKAGLGSEIVPGGRGGGKCLLAASTGPESYHGTFQEVTFDPPLRHPFQVSGWSKAENASGADYCLYMDVWYADGTNLWGQRGSFRLGTHDWEQAAFVFDVAKPVTKIQYFVLFRRCTGKAWFDDVSLQLAPFAVQKARLSPSLYDGNSLDAALTLTLPAQWQAQVLRGQEVVAEQSGAGRGVLVAWDGRDRAGTLLPGGQYRLRVTAKDDLLGQTLTVEKPFTTRSGPGKGYVAWTESSMTRVLVNSLPPGGGGPLNAGLALAGGEWESYQVALRTAPGAELKDCHVKLTPLRDAAGHVLSAANLQWHQVGFVEYKELNQWTDLPEEATPGWWPDPLLPVRQFSVPSAFTQPLWFTVYAPPGTPAGTYRGTVTVTPANAPALTVNVAARVYGFDLPIQGHLKTAFALMDGYLEKLYGKPLTAKLRRQYGDYVLQHHLNPDDISRTAPPDLDDLAYYNTRGLNAFNVINMVQPRGERTWVCWSPLEVYTPTFKQQLIARLDPYVAELKRRGLADKAYVYTFDERGQEFWPIMREYFGLIKQRYGLPTLTTAYLAQDPKLLKDLNVDWNCPLTPKYNYEQAQECRRQGLQVWAYTCCGPRRPYANILGDDPLIQSRVLYWQAYQQQMDGFLFWGLNIWGRANNDYLIDPEKDGPKLRWSITTGRPGSDWTAALHGDGELLYPGKDGPIGCIRLANIRDGLEDYEYLHRLAELGGGVEAARKACLPVTESLAIFTNDPRVVSAQRERIAAQVEKLTKR